MHAILVLNDGDTWSPIGGASVCFVTDEQLAELDEGAGPGSIEPMIELVLTSPWVHTPDGGDESN